VMDLLGLWVKELVRESTCHCELKVVSPVPYCPPIPGLPNDYSRFRGVVRSQWEDGVEVFHPRFAAGPGYSTHQIEWLLYYAGIRKTVEQLHRHFQFDLIHAHFTYPDGVVATHLGQRYRKPVVITEQNLWGPWMNKYPGVLKRAIGAARRSTRYIAVSEPVRSTVEQFAGELGDMVVIPNGVDGSVFKLPEAGQPRDSNRVLFVGAIRPVKGVDILLKTMRLLVDRGRNVQLLLAGEAFYGPYRREEQRLKEMTNELNLRDVVQFAGKKSPPELAKLMQESGVLVLPSRAESLGMVLVESLACGTPVVATRCGGPEDIVTDDVGVLVRPEDPEALASGIEHVLDHHARFDRAKLRHHALQKFGLETVGRRLFEVYEEAAFRFQGQGIMSPDGKVAAKA
jgi:glycosyltransferase involved in cell wall biosynthesis